MGLTVHEEVSHYSKGFGMDYIWLAIARKLMFGIVQMILKLGLVVRLEVGAQLYLHNQ